MGCDSLPIDVLEKRKAHICKKESNGSIACDKKSVAGAVSQKACVYCGSRVVLNPIADALHLVHGPIGCATYTWDIRGSLSSGPGLHRLSFSTDLGEREIVFGGEDKLYRALSELIDKYTPKAAFVYSTCTVGIIGDDIDAVCKRVENEKNIPVISVKSEGFKGNKQDGYKAACIALYRLIGKNDNKKVSPYSINIMGDFNLAGEIWVIREYYKKIGVEVVANLTGDSRVDDISSAHKASLNVVQCSGSMMFLAKMMKDEFGIPFMRASYFGVEDMGKAILDVAYHFGDKSIIDRAERLILEETEALNKELGYYRERLEGKKAAIYVGGAFKAQSLIKAFRLIGMDTVFVGSQTGKKEDYDSIKGVADTGTIIIDDASSLELVDLVRTCNVDILVGGVKERPIAYKLGVAFCDHNHQRKLILEGFVGMLNFAKEVASSILSPVWQLPVVRRK